MAGPADEEQFELKLVFLRELSEGYKRARASQERLLLQPPEVGAVKELRDFFHKIAGTAETVELPLLGRICAACETAADMTIDGAIADPHRAAVLFREGLEAVATVLDLHGTGTGEPKVAPSKKESSAGLVVSDAVGEGRGLSKILVVDDDPYSARLVDSCLRAAGFMSSYCSDSTKALSVIEAELPDLIILDVVMPAIDGFALCRRVREHPALQLTPIIFVTRKGDVEQRVRGLEVGGNDYIAKPFEPRELVARVRSHLSRLSTLREMAIRDGLTRCFNHKYFKLRLDQEMQRAKRYKMELTMAMLDIDHFKNVNDSHGHPVGDMVLAYLSSIILASVRSTDVVARYGGEEFAILLVQASAAEAGVIANRMRERIASSGFTVPKDDGGELKIPLTVSMGVTQQLPTDDLAALIRRADECLYESKRGGRNRVTVQGPEAAAAKV